MQTPPTLKRCLLTVGLAAFALAAAPLACNDGSDSTSPEDSLRAAKIGMSEAITAAEAELPGGVTVEAEFELGRDGALFEVEILVDGEVREVMIDPRDGRVLDVANDPEDLDEARESAEQLAAASLSLSEAVAIAERKTGGTAFEVEIDERGFALALLTDGGPIEVLVSASDGSIVATEPGASGPEVEDDDDDELEDDDGEDDD